METNKIILTIGIIFMLITTSCAVMGTPQADQTSVSHTTTVTADYTQITSTYSEEFPNAITVSHANPFYALIATPLAIHYSETGEQFQIPLYIKNLENPSEAVQRAEEDIGISADFIIDDSFPPKELSSQIISAFWTSASGAMVIGHNQQGYELGVVAAPLASYLGIPILVADEIDQDILDHFQVLGVEYAFLCGIDPPSTAEPVEYIQFTTIDDIINITVDVLDTRLQTPVHYITLANPLDVFPPEVYETESYSFSGEIASSVFLPSQAVGVLKNSAFGMHEFEIPKGYKYTRLTINLTNCNSEYVDEVGDRLLLMILSPDGERYVYAGTAGGIPLRDQQGNIIKDRVQFETIIYDKPGTYTAQVFGQLLGHQLGAYELDLSIESIEHPYVATMDQLSTIAPYLTASHMGIIYAKPEFAFAANDHILYNGSTCPGVTQPGTNPNLVQPSNNHTLALHDEFIGLLADLADISTEDKQELWQYYTDNPVYVAITADPTMVPMYFYYNPDGKPDNSAAFIMGFALPSDFIWADIDVDHDDLENNTFSYWPQMENMVGRVTGSDAQDASALIARTFYYENVLENLNDWKSQGLVATGCGLEFQNLPLATRIGKLLGRLTGTGRDEPTKAFTGESNFINKRIGESMESGGYEVKNTIWLQSQREGYSEDDLALIKNLGVFNKLLFPQKLILLLNSKEKVTGASDQLGSSLIFTFAHGIYNLYEAGDVFIGSRGFPGVTMFSRIFPQIRSGLSAKGSFDVRSVHDMEYGPSVIFVVSCITGRTDGIRGENTLSQAYLHAGANAYVGATRVTADPGYLEPRPLPGGWGIGTLGLLKAILDFKLRGTYPDLHFGAVIGEDFILDLIQNDSTTGMALRNAKNKYLEKDANSTFLWTPPLSISTGLPFLDEEIRRSTSQQLSGNDRTRVLDKKYVALHEFTLYGDPAFNPYQPINNG